MKGGEAMKKKIIMKNLNHIYLYEGSLCNWYYDPISNMCEFGDGFCCYY